MEKVCKYCQQKFISKYASQIFCSLRCSNRLHLNNRNIVNTPKHYSADLAELFGILLGDGSVTQYFAKVYLNAIADAGYAPYVKKLIGKLFVGAHISCWHRPRNGTSEIQISSKDACDYLRNIGFNAKLRNIPSWITKNDSFAKAAIRGLFDTEGSVGMKYFHGKEGKYLYKQLTVTNKNENILKFLEKSLTKFGYKPTKNSRKNIYLSNSPDIFKYLRDIGCGNPKLTYKILVKEINAFKYGARSEGWQRGRMHES